MRILPVVLMAAVGAGCASARPVSIPQPASAPHVPSPAARQALLDACRTGLTEAPSRSDDYQDLDAILWQQTAAEYRANTTTVYRAATDALPGLAKAARKALPRKDPVVIFDLDETIFDNSRFQGWLLASQHEYRAGVWDCWVGHRQAGSVAGSELLFREMAKEGIRGRFITNRRCLPRPGDPDPCPQKAETLDNLNAILADTGYVASPDELLLSGDKDPRTQSEWPSEKQPRRDFVSATHAIVMLVGDDLGDFLEGVREGTIEARDEQLAAAKDRWGSSWFLLPNPSYGSWVTAVDKAAPSHRRDLVKAFDYPKD